jgi:PAS domain S-box-containing protein
MTDPVDYKALWEAEKAHSAQLQTELEYAKQKSVSIFENAGDSIFIVDFADYTIVDANSHASRRLGYKHDELIGMSLYDIEVDVENDPKIDSSWESDFSGTQVYECYHRRKDGQLIPIEVSSRIVNLNNREVILIFARNIELRKLVRQRELEITLEQERLKLLTTFIQNASHEFRTPLTTIMANNYLIPKLDDLPKRQERSEIIQSQVQRITNLVDMLLLMAKIESDSSHHPEPLQLLPLIQRIAEEYRLKFGDKPTLSLNLSANLPTIFGDQDHLDMTIRQLLDNAYRFTSVDGSITVSTGTTDTVWISIQDTGHGIANEDLPHIFETFWRKDEAHSLHGFGLGLPIAQKIIEQHNGTLEIESVIEKGTTVHITLPIHNETSKKPTNRF